MKIGTKIKQQRKKKGLTQKELASILGLGGVTTVASWEQGLSNPPAKRIPAIADALDISVSELLGNDDAKPKNRGAIPATMGGRYQPAQWRR